MTCGREGSGLVPELWSKPLWRRVWPFLDAWDSVRPRTAAPLLLDSEEAGNGAEQ